MKDEAVLNRQLNDHCRYLCAEPYPLIYLFLNIPKLFTTYSANSLPPIPLTLYQSIWLLKNAADLSQGWMVQPEK